MAFYYSVCTFKNIILFNSLRVYSYCCDTGMSNDTANVSQPEVPVNASRPDPPMNVRIPEINITHESFVVQWDAVMDTSGVNYTIRWIGDDGINATATVNTLSYTVTGLTKNTSYSVTVFAINTCCGPGPASEVITVMTGVLPTTLPPVTQPPPGANGKSVLIISNKLGDRNIV